MRIVKRHLATLVVGSLVVVGISYAGAQAFTASDDRVVLAQQEGREKEQDRARGMRPRLHGAIRGELVVRGDEEGTFRTVRIDRGVVERVDGTTVVIKEDDGTVVEVPTSEDTRIARDGEESEVSDLRAGDHVFTHRVDEGEGFVTKGVRAFSPERWAEMQQRREQCREDPQECRRDRRSRRSPGGEPAA